MAINMAKKVAKTNAVRIIEQQKIQHELFEYEMNEGDEVGGRAVARKVGFDVAHVYKTLVTTAGANKFFVFVIPVEGELNLKAAAKVVGEKKIEMIHVKELLPLTGYIRGGCSPIGMKKQYPTFIDESAFGKEFVLVSAGKIGLQMKLSPQDLAKAAKAKFAALVVE